MKKVLIEKIPEIKEGIKTKKWWEKIGELVQITYNKEMRHLVIFEIREGFTRGSPNHERKEENLLFSLWKNEG